MNNVGFLLRCDKDLVCATLARGDGLQKIVKYKNTWSKFDNVVNTDKLRLLFMLAPILPEPNMHAHEESKRETLAASCPAPFPLPHYVHYILSFATLKTIHLKLQRPLRNAITVCCATSKTLLLHRCQFPLECQLEHHRM